MIDKEVIDKERMYAENQLKEKSGSNIVVEWMSAIKKMQKMDMPCLAQMFIRKMKNFKGLLVCVMQ